MATVINPYTVYDLNETSEILGVNRKTIYREVKARNLSSKRLGKGGKHLFLGESLLRYLGSITYSEAKK